MKCPFCAAESHVIDTREVASAIRRRRECDVCDQRFTTYERVAAANLQIVKSDGRREDFSREKLLRGLLLACAKRPVAAETIDSVANEVEAQLYRWGRSEIPSDKLGELVMTHLRDLDDVAYVRFASVYRKFTDLEHLMDEIHRLRERRLEEEERRGQLALGF
jgi:transcriptional repressor NrdR